MLAPQRRCPVERAGDDVVRRAYHGGPRIIFGDWTLGGTLFFRTGLPFTSSEISVKFSSGSFRLFV